MNIHVTYTLSQIHNFHITHANGSNILLHLLSEAYTCTRRFSNNKLNKAYRPNAHLLHLVMHYNGNII